MTRRILASGLLKTASTLAGHGAGRGRPALADLRRATSTAYYALFHQVIRHGSLVFLPGATEPEIAEISRWFTHTGVYNAATVVLDADSGRPTEQLAKANRSAVMAIRSAAGSFSPPKELILLAEGFQQLQNARHRADYDGNYDPVRAVTVGHVLDAEAAVHAAREMWRSGETGSAKNVNWRPSYECFLRLALLKSGGPRSR